MSFQELYAGLDDLKKENVDMSKVIDQRFEQLEKRIAALEAAREPSCDTLDPATEKHFGVKPLPEEADTTTGATVEVPVPPDPQEDGV